MVRPLGGFSIAVPVLGRHDLSSGGQLGLAVRAAQASNSSDGRVRTLPRTLRSEAQQAREECSSHLCAPAASAQEFVLTGRLGCEAVKVGPIVEGGR